eukprot:gene7832-10638_t
MGASASVRLVFSDATHWFETYFTESIYKSDFESMDKDHDGGISFSEMELFIKEKAAKEGGGWATVLSHHEVLEIAHNEAAKHEASNAIKDSKKVFSIVEFQIFLINLFAISILWAHFKSADNWIQGSEYGNEILSFEEFSFAAKTFCKTHAHEEITDEQIRADFAIMDVNHSGSLPFAEICGYFCKFIDPNYHAIGEKVSSTIEPEIHHEIIHSDHHVGMDEAFNELSEIVNLNEDTANMILASDL